MPAPPLPLTPFHYDDALPLFHYAYASRFRADAAITITTPRH
jgi:hypothetical protein